MPKSKEKKMLPFFVYLCWENWKSASNCCWRGSPTFPLHFFMFLHCSLGNWYPRWPLTHNNPSNHKVNGIKGDYKLFYDGTIEGEKTKNKYWWFTCSNRIPEAALMARSYLPSKVSEIVAIWRNDLNKVRFLQTFIIVGK